MKVYLSLPISGYDEHERRTFAARTCGFLTFEHEDWEVTNPFHIYDRLRKERLDKGDFSLPSYGEVMGEDIKALRSCELVIFCQGWYASEGCLEEMRECWWHGKGIGFLSEEGKVFF